MSPISPIPPPHPLDPLAAPSHLHMMLRSFSKLAGVKYQQLRSHLCTSFSMRCRFTVYRSSSSGYRPPGRGVGGRDEKLHLSPHWEAAILSPPPKPLLLSLKIHLLPGPARCLILFLFSGRVSLICRMDILPQRVTTIAGSEPLPAENWTRRMKN